MMIWIYGFEFEKFKIKIEIKKSNRFANVTRRVSNKQEKGMTRADVSLQDACVHNKTIGATKTNQTSQPIQQIMPNHIQAIHIMRMVNILFISS